ncbi:hypothetical protein [Microbacterium suwonense]|uniref:Uncharacterized protein n=1 Tax=Microbacterium suwonense TaxID=683047 RepID=A0ABM8FQR5_9MICO|nr:hypothetical protein [Microbacterium suwonense]BDZ38014.1 hypothetical protein GCM10025863_06280 [Microbacterium suwonense]
MTPTAFLAGLVLGFLAVTAILGVASLLAWRRHRAEDFPTTKVTTHIALQVASIMLWIVFLVTMRPWVAWTAFAVITAGQVFGDLLMFASYRARHRIAKAGSYIAVAKDVLGFTRPVPALHAIIGALGWLAMLVVCILATPAY